LGEVTESGKPVFVPLDRVRTHRNTDKRGRFVGTTTIACPSTWAGES
jgi:hypothetical protein